MATDPDDPDEDIVYSVVTNPNPEALTASMDGSILVLVRETEDGAEFDLVMRATSDGQYVDFNIHVIIKEMEGVEENQNAMTVYPNPTNDMVAISIESNSGFTYQVLDFMGRSVLQGKIQDRVMTLDLSGLGKGAYLISVVTENKRLTQKVVVY